MSEEGRGGGPVRVGRVLEDVLERRGVRKQIERVSALEAWADVVGDGIAAVTRARSVADATLFVEVRSSAWLMELEMMKGEILPRLNEGRDEALIEKIHFVLGEGGAEGEGTS